MLIHNKSSSICIGLTLLHCKHNNTLRERSRKHWNHCKYKHICCIIEFGLCGQVFLTYPPQILTYPPHIPPSHTFSHRSKEFFQVQHSIYIYWHIDILISYIRHRAFSGEACQFLFLLLWPFTPVWASCLQVPGVPGSGEPVLDRSLPWGWSWRWLFQGPHISLSQFIGVTRFPWKVVKNNTSKRVPENT